MIGAKGFVKIPRMLLLWRWYKNDSVKSVFIHILLTANYKDVPWENIVIKRGQLVTSYENLAKETGHSIQEIRTILKKLKSTGEITVEATNRYTLISVVKWEEYQVPEGEATSDEATELTNNQQTINNQLTNNQQQIKNIENIKNNKKEREEAAAEYAANKTRTQYVNKFVPPSADEVKAYCAERGNSINSERFVEYYTARGWDKISDWRAAVRSWETTEREKPAVSPPTPKNKFNNFTQKPTDYAAIKEKQLQRLLKKWE